MPFAYECALRDWNRFSAEMNYANAMWKYIALQMGDIFLLMAGAGWIWGMCGKYGKAAIFLCCHSDVSICILLFCSVMGTERERETICLSVYSRFLQMRPILTSWINFPNKRSILSLDGYAIFRFQFEHHIHF